jgi:Tol biopolymer transport system component
MPLTAGTRIGGYEIGSAIGAGGMGEVYRARDTRLDRDVAIKILPEPFASDPERVARFEREAKTLAALSHPNIAIVHGVEDVNGSRALVMELVHGPTLADRIAGGRIALDDAVDIARQVAAALEAAHSQGIVHRDLKPANVKIRDEGTVKVLDFGLAKALSPAAASGSGLTMSPTLSLQATNAGVILGTAAYMAPEQARGRAVDTRADIWAFGVVLFEMLAGQRPFDGESISDTLASILKSEPQWSALPSDVPPSVVRVLRRCLQKDPQKRLQHIGDARLDLDEPESAPRAQAGHRIRGERLLWGAALMVAVAAAGLLAWQGAERAIRPERRLEIAYPGFGGFAISPDGRYVAYSADTGSGPTIWLRPLSPPIEPRIVAGTEGGTYPFWSPDSRSLGFFTSASLKRIDIDGGNPATLASVITPAGGAWSGNTILFVPNDNGGVFSVSAAGGDEPKPITGSLVARRPHFLPDGRHFLFYVARGGESTGIYAGELGVSTVRRVTAADGPALYAMGHLWFVRDAVLLAQPFDLAALAPTGTATTIAQAVPVSLFEAAVAVSEAGLVGYRQGLEEVTARQLVWFDRDGNKVGTINDPDSSLVANPELSRDGARLAVQRTLKSNTDVWTVDLSRSSSFLRLTDALDIDSLPLWSPDATRLLFNSLEQTPQDRAQFTIKSLDGRSHDQRLRMPTTAVVIGCDWSPDGKYLLYKTFDRTLGPQSTGTDLLASPLEGATEPIVVAKTVAEERDGQFEPTEGKWIAYESDRSGRPEIYVKPFIGPGEPVQVSVAGGRQVRWRRDGREIFYIALDGTLMAVAVNGALPTGLGKASPLFKTSLAPARSISRQQYVVKPDGKQFLMVVREGTPPPITLVLDWRPSDK